MNEHENPEAKDADEGRATDSMEAQKVKRASFMESASRVTPAQNVQVASQADQAFETAFHENWERVVVVLFRMLGDEAEAEDLALETFYRLREKQPGLESVESLRGWLYRVATNLGLNALRASQRRLRYEMRAGSLDLQNQVSDNPADEVERRQERQWVRQALAGMKPRSAQLVLLRHAGFSYAEISAVLGVAPTSVGTLLARAEVEFGKSYRQLAK